MKTKIGVLGSAGGELSSEVREKARQLGREIAKHDCILVTGACPGLPHEAVLGAKEYGALVVGISPALALSEHIERYHSPYEPYDVLVYTGSGLMGREIEIVRTCDLVILVGGRTGTLGEFAIAYDEGKLIGALQGTGGVADNLDKILAITRKSTGAQVVCESDPALLVETLLNHFLQRVEAGTAYLPPRADG